MLTRLVIRLSRLCDRYLAAHYRRGWQGGHGCDATCSYCGYLCHSCGRPQ